MDCILGVDGGNTKTVALLADFDGRIIGTGRSGCSDPYTFPSCDGAVAEIERAVRAALTQAGRTPEHIVSACYSLAGADWQEDYVELRDGLRGRGLGKTVTVYNDAIGALRAGSPDGTGVVINCGTGGAMAARNAAGEFWHTSYWQDSMGGRALGYEALRAVRHADIGMEPPTVLTEVVLSHFNVTTVAEMLRRFWTRGVPAPTDIDVSKLAPKILNAAEEGDLVALRMVENHAIHLVEYALASARKVGMQHTPFTLILNGGVFRHPGTVMRSAITRRVRQESPDVQVVTSRFEPVVGALMLAFEETGLAITPELTAQFEATMPTADLF
ncbi:MAG: hypothetical protein IAE80_11055, partial [Anaerolinea sp.]|nr:hypothetical protein [Anaerolinea sp.]